MSSTGHLLVVGGGTGSNPVGAADFFLLCVFDLWKNGVKVYVD